MLLVSRDLEKQGQIKYFVTLASYNALYFCAT